jgi:hypothetical protein
MQCSYVDRRQRQCPTAWCEQHCHLVFNANYCRRHAGVIAALGANFGELVLPDLDNRAPSLASWVARDLDGPIRTLLQTAFPGESMNVTGVVSGGAWRERTWGCSWKIISPLGVDCSVSVTVLEADDGAVRAAFDGKEILEIVPPWIEARRQGVTIEAETDTEERRRFYERILEALEDALMAAKRRRHEW